MSRVEGGGDDDVATPHQGGAPEHAARVDVLRAEVHSSWVHETVLPVQLSLAEEKEISTPWNSVSVQLPLGTFLHLF